MFKFVAGALCLLALQHCGWSGIESAFVSVGRAGVVAVGVAQDVVQGVAK